MHAREDGLSTLLPRSEIRRANTRIVAHFAFCAELHRGFEILLRALWIAQPLLLVEIHEGDVFLVVFHFVQASEPSVASPVPENLIVVLFFIILLVIFW